MKAKDISSHLHVLFDLFLLVSQLSKGINDQTYNHKDIIVTISSVTYLGNQSATKILHQSLPKNIVQHVI